jgi:hypothetical protein
MIKYKESLSFHFNPTAELEPMECEEFDLESTHSVPDMYSWISMQCLREIQSLLTWQFYWRDIWWRYEAIYCDTMAYYSILLCILTVVMTIETKTVYLTHPGQQLPSLKVASTLFILIWHCGPTPFSRINMLTNIVCKWASNMSDLNQIQSKLLNSVSLCSEAESIGKFVLTGRKRLSLDK